MEGFDSFLGKLAARARFGMRQGLETTRYLLHAIGDPERGMRFIHIAGTNGKGATAAMLDSVLRAAGFAVARYTSPHLLKLNERFFLDGAPASSAALERAAAPVFGAAERLEREGGGAATFFECLTAAAFSLFREWADAAERAGKTPIAILETGLGGRLDATNAIGNPLVCAITRIGLDHCQWLGDTVAAIAREKAGIIKPGCPVVCGAMPEEALEEMEKTAEGRGAPLFAARSGDCVSVTRPDPSGQVVDVAFNGETLRGVRLPLAGAFQRENAATALAVLGELSRQGFAIPAGAVRSGLECVEWPGRFQCVSRNPHVIVDGAHNPPGAKALADAVRDCALPGPVTAVAGFCADKDVESILREFAGFARSLYAVAVDNPRTMAPAETASTALKAGFAFAEPCGSFAEAIAKARARAAAEGGSAVICGSLFLAGEALAALGALPGAQGAGARDPGERLFEC